MAQPPHGSVEAGDAEADRLSRDDSVVTETTPLLGSRSDSTATSVTLPGESNNGLGRDLEPDAGAPKQLSTLRAVLVILGLWVLIFLQGEFGNPISERNAEDRQPPTCRA